MQSIDNKILSRIYGRGKGSVFTPGDFLDIGSRESVDLALHRFTKKGTIRHLARGLYDYPKIDPDFGLLSPTTDAIVKALKGRDNILLQPSGGYAANLLGLSEQIPMKIIYLTEGSGRRIQIGRQIIVLKHTTPKVMATAGRASGLVIQALKHVGRNHLDDSVVTKLKNRLSIDEKKQLIQDLRYAPTWIAVIMRSVAQEEGGLHGKVS